MREGTVSRVTAADRLYGEFYDFYSVIPGVGKMSYTLAYLALGYYLMLNDKIPPYIAVL